jgi:hypothetical protein
VKTFQSPTQERFDVVHAHRHEGALIGLVVGRLFGCQSARPQALPDCVDAAQFRSADTYAPEDRIALRREVGIPPERKVIVYLGLLAEYPSAGLLLEALRPRRQPGQFGKVTECADLDGIALL